MTPEQVDYVKEQLSTKWGSPIRKMFYTNRGLPRQKLYSKQQILDYLEIPEPENMFEKEGINHRLHVSLSQLRNEAKKHGLSFVDFRIEQNEGRDTYYHGFVRDVDKIEQTIALYNQRVEQSEELYRVTYDVATSQIKMLEQKAG